MRGSGSRARRPRHVSLKGGPARCDGRAPRLRAADPCATECRPRRRRGPRGEGVPRAVSEEPVPPDGDAVKKFDGSSAALPNARMQRILASLLAALVAVVLAACSGATQDLGAGTSTGLQGQGPHARRRGLPDGVRRRQDLLPEPAAGGSALHDELPVRAGRGLPGRRVRRRPGPARSPTPACCHRERQCQRQRRCRALPRVARLPRERRLQGLHVQAWPWRVLHEELGMRLERLFRGRGLPLIRGIP